MRVNNKIIKIKGIDFPNISFISRNNESRIINLKTYFKKINLEKGDFGHEIIEDSNVFNSVTLENNALAWKEINKIIILPSGKKIETFFHLDPILTIEYSDLIPNSFIKLGKKIKSERKEQKLSQEELGKRIGTTKNYISKVENAKTGIEFNTLEKIFEVGLNKNIYLIVYDNNTNNKISALSNSLLKPSFINWIKSRKNDLTLIEGIGQIEIDHFRVENIISPTQLSSIDFLQLIDILTKNHKSLSNYHHVDSWLIQAKYFANCDWASLIMLQKTVGNNHSKIEDLAKEELEEDIFVE